MEKKIIISGFGGQGIMSMGQILAASGMAEGRQVSWLPSYGPEMRGGSANCSVIISDDPIGAPNVTQADSLIVMNEPSLEKFEENLLPGGNLYINSSLIGLKPKRDDINVYYIAVNELANEVSPKSLNMVMLGAFQKIENLIDEKNLWEGFSKVYGEKAEKIIDINKKAYQMGYNSL